MLQPGQLHCWAKNIGKICNALNNTRRKKSRKTTNMGGKSRLEPYREEILSFVNLMQEQGKTVSTRIVAARAK